MMETVKTTCPYCGVGCGVKLNVHSDTVIGVEGDEQHPSNWGRLCSKGLSLGETIDFNGRLLEPQINKQPASWDKAINTVATALSKAVKEYGPDSVAFYVSGQLLTEDYYVANKLLKACIGTANIDTNSRLCMSSAVVGYKRAFGMDSVPCCYEDLEQTDLLVMTGSNAAWCHPVLFQRIRAAKEARANTDNPMKIVVIDPRKTPSCDIADLHLPIKPGADVALFTGLLAYLSENNQLDTAFIEQHTHHFTQALKRAGEFNLHTIAQHCALNAEDVNQFFEWFLKYERTISFYSMGVNQSSSGSDKANSIINVHLATGRIGKVGAGPFSITGQPNAMGGREVGGLANQMAAHMDFANEQHKQLVEEFWQAPNMAQHNGLNALDMFEAVESGKIKVIWIMATNPIVSLPDANRWKKALQQCDMVVVSDCEAFTDTTACANVLLPATAWGEKTGTVTNSERRISRQIPFRKAPEKAQHDWWIICEVAKAMGFEQWFSFKNEWEIFKEHAGLSGYKNTNDTLRDFDISGLANISQADYNRLKPIQWPVKKEQGTARLYENNVFFTPSGKAQFVAVEYKKPTHALSDEYPLVLNTGRIRDQWHTMTRTGKSERLSAHLLEPFVQVHPTDAKGCVEQGQLARVSSQWGDVLARVEVSEEQQKGCVFVPIHWSEQFASSSRVGAVVNPAVDPFSGQPEFKHTPVKLSAYQPKWQGFLLSREALAIELNGYCVKAKGKQFWRYELAGAHHLTDPRAWLENTLNDAHASVLDYCDEAKGHYRAGVIQNNKLQAVLFIAPDHHLPSRAWLSQLFEEPELTSATRQALLAGRPADNSNDAGETVCSCFGVGVNTLSRTIEELLASKGECTPEEVGACLKAGTNCGSCVPEIRGIIELLELQATKTA